MSFTKQKLISRSVDLSILTASFLVACMQFESTVLLETSITTLTAVYAITAFVLMRLSKQIFNKFIKTHSAALSMACGNALGLCLTAVALTVVTFFLPGMNQVIPLIIISSIASFFVLGTIAPAVHKAMQGQNSQPA